MYFFSLFFALASISFIHLLFGFNDTSSNLTLVLSFSVFSFLCPFFLLFSIPSFRCFSFYVFCQFSSLLYTTPVVFTLSFHALLCSLVCVLIIMINIIFYFLLCVCVCSFDFPMY